MRLVVIGLTLAALAGAASADLVTLSPTQDHQIRPNYSYGPSEGVLRMYNNYVDPTYGSTTIRSLMAFDLSSVNDQIVKGVLRLTVDGFPPPVTWPTGQTVTIHRVVTPWTESSATTWTMPWTSAGGDYDSAVIGEYHPEGSYDHTRISIELDAQALEGMRVANNYGLLFQTTVGGRFIVYSKDVGTQYAAWWPELELTTIPAPGAALLGVIGLGLVGWVKRRFA